MAENMYSDTIFHPDDVVDEILIQKLNKCLKALPENQFKIIDMFYYKKKSYNEISEHINDSWSKVRSLIQNGRRNLKNCLQNKSQK